MDLGCTLKRFQIIQFEEDWERKKREKEKEGATEAEEKDEQRKNKYEKRNGATASFAENKNTSFTQEHSVTFILSAFLSLFLCCLFLPDSFLESEAYFYLKK